MTPVALKYIDDVMEGRRLTCKWERLAVERHLRDLKDGPSRGLEYVPALGDRFVRYCAMLKHWKGSKFAGKPFVPDGWQQFFQCALFGWQRAGGFRRFRTAVKFVPRKNGKSTEAGAIGDYMATADGEPGAEVYAGATTRRQAREVFEHAANLLKSAPGSRRLVQFFRNSYVLPSTKSKFEILCADGDTQDGLNPHCGILDELHAHSDRSLWDVIESAFGAREQPLMLGISTAGFDTEGICHELWQYAYQVLEGTVEDDSFFGIVYTVDEGDAWDDERSWEKANPGLGVSVSRDYLRDMARKAKVLPAAQNNFRTKHLNQFTEQETRWLDLALWDRGGKAFDVAALNGRECWGGLDLASVSDLAAFLAAFPNWPAEGHWTLLPLFWLPRGAVERFDPRDRARYTPWIEAGLVRVTPTKALDYDRVRADLNEFAKRFALRGFAYDRWNSSQLIGQLEGDGLKPAPFGQGYASMSPACKLFESLLLDERLHHGGHKVLRWNAANCAVEQDAAGNLKPSKKHSKQKIDGIVAAVMALGFGAQQKPKRVLRAEDILGEE